ncbi:pyridoxamine 5'-phosphate oxidase family protein [Methylophaga pinxianii]|uniref:pyridoxamine 5'-phosphate oxidase family protein n=1 Tax=Methylophaga pinxianii TaxID=2881052 RepID=UPI001CF38CAA|nr:pyridoxamine 5'-phosphate oxidase family protein [Methylophaga pinxianii]MCB2428121.1 pyridoxamine 5'-phosphate oxidase family protein [Methylophaga pinxianii]UPH45443.1 pyridoxamine 5'-phosphate oxidase family protein [Methylophaga pinxianii]
MAQQFMALSDRLIEFILKQHLFFVATATADSRINISPKGMDSLKVLNPNRVIWLNVTGSGNETAAHIEENPRMTLMFCAFDGKPLILRLYGQARAVHRKDAEWQSLYAQFDSLPGARQIFILDIDLVQTSCGMAVPCFEFVGDRELLNNWAERKGDTGIKEYWREKNQFSLDGIETDIVKKNI